MTPETPEEKQESALLRTALNEQDPEDISDPALLVQAAVQLLGAASMALLTLADMQHPTAAVTTPDQRDRWSVYGTVALAFRDVLAGEPGEEARRTVARATEHITSASEDMRGWFPSSLRARMYRRERGLD
jgi:hypothetical protein